MAVATVAECFKIYGRDTLVTALQCVTRTANAETLGLLVGPVIKALCDVLHYRQDWRDAGGALLEAFDAIDVADQAERARLEPKGNGISTSMVLTARLNDRLNKVPALARKAA